MEKKDNRCGTLGLKSQFWTGLVKDHSEDNEIEEKGCAFLDKNIRYTKRDMTEEDKQKIIQDAQEVICWKLTTDRHTGKFVFLGFRIKESGMIRVDPSVLFVHDDIIYAWCYMYKAVKFSTRLNYECFTMMFNIIESENLSLTRSHEIMMYIKAKQETPIEIDSNWRPEFSEPKEQ